MIVRRTFARRHADRCFQCCLVSQIEFDSPPPPQKKTSKPFHSLKYLSRNPFASPPPFPLPTSPFSLPSLATSHLYISNSAQAEKTKKKQETKTSPKQNIRGGERGGKGRGRPSKIRSEGRGYLTYWDFPYFLIPKMFRFFFSFSALCFFPSPPAGSEE